MALEERISLSLGDLAEMGALGALIPISTAPAVEPAMMERNALG
jgi:hypothetical protein